ncbi:MAG TPA: alpha/beta hydrolase domain-containing protein [Candidatus Polarisedimenticolia bacterium]|nr:alpha/beta hydrolase domain-containing protein [Candidatus Polarisedimenticolia bacterium]
MHALHQRLVWVLTLLIVFCVSTADAHVTRVEIVSREDVQAGRTFGLAGAYEKIVGRLYFAVSPENVHNRQVVDLDKAPRNAQGEVEFSADLYLYKPKDMNKGNGAVLFEVSNRGGRGILRLVDGGNSSDANGEFGDGFLLREGYTIAWLGWQFDLAEEGQKVRLSAPVARNPGGKEIRGLVRSDFTPSQKIDEMPLGHIMLGPSGGKSYPADDPASTKNVLTVRDTPEGSRQSIPRSQWSFAHSLEGKLVADAHYIHLDGRHLDGGFLPGKIYEVVYEAKDPAVVGVGLAAVRDFLSYLKYDPQATAPVRRVYAVGISQSGRFLRHFLYQNFNADEQGRQVMDGVIAHVAGAGRGSFNHRFAQPSRDAQPLSSIFFPTDVFPYTDLPENDPETGETAGLLDAAGRSHTAPKIFFTNTSYEYWGRAASLIHTSADGLKDAAPGENARIYFLSGLQHFSAAFPPAKATAGSPELTAQQRHNPNPIQWFWRALITDMDQWVKDGTPPPTNVYPKIADSTLVPLSKWKFPKIPGVNTPHEVSLAYHLDFGSQWKSGIISNEPPKVGKPFVVFVPQADADGNDLGGVRLPELQVPLATYTGWNLRDPSIGAPDLRISFLGAFLPFARAASDRGKSGDPRLSIAERYASREQYMGKFAEAAMKLIQDRFLLREDLPAVLERGRREWDEVAGEK